MHRLSIVGLDSAWADNPRAPGALSALRQTNDGHWEWVAPVLVGFDTAADLIAAEAQGAQKCFVAIDQPTIVPNAVGARPVDRVIASPIAFVGGGVQPASRARLGLFDDAAPIWRFKQRLDTNDDPERARKAIDGLFIAEVFPALALLSFAQRFAARLGAPRYNPARRKTFRHADWLAVIDTVAAIATEAGIAPLEEWCAIHRQLAKPTKADQDRLDAVLCALIGWHWLTQPRESSIMIGDLTAGYVIAPASASIRTRLEHAARQRGVAVDGRLP